TLIAVGKRSLREIERRGEVVRTFANSIRVRRPGRMAGRSRRLRRGDHRPALERPLTVGAVTIVVALIGLVLSGSALLDAFETVVLPRRVSRRLRLGYVFYALTWRPYGAVAMRMEDGMRRETFLSFYGPLSLLLLVSLWAITLILGFAALHWVIGTPLSTPDGPADYLSSAYYSGTTFFTLGLVDVLPRSCF